MKALRESYDRLAAVLCFVGAFLLYLLTLAPSVGAGDSGELCIAARYLGVAHPTGFPLYCLLGRLFCLLPAGDIAYRMNLFSAFTSAGTALVLFLLFRELSLTRRAAFCGACLYALSRTCWSQAVVARVYPLAAFFMALQLLLAARLAFRKFSGPTFIALHAAYAMGLAVHVINLPGIVLVAWSHARARRAADASSASDSAGTPPRDAARARRAADDGCAGDIQGRPGRRVHLAALAALLLCPLLYLYIPLRSLADPPIDFGNPDSPRRIVDYFTQRSYRNKQFTRSASNQVALFFEIARSLRDEAGSGWLVFALCACFCIPGEKRKFMTLAATIVLATVAIVFAYGDDKDIQFAPYYLYSLYFSLSACAAFFVDHLSDRFPSRTYILSSVCLLLLLAEGAGNFRLSDRSDLLAPRLLAEALLDTPDRDKAVVFVRGDSLLFPARYIQLTRKRRTRLKLLSDCAWDPRLPFRYPVYLSFRPAALPVGARLVQRGLLYVCTKDPAYSAKNRETWDSYDLSAVFNGRCPYPDYKTAAVISDLYFKRAGFYLGSGDTGRARRLYMKALACAPRNRLVYYNTARVLSRPPFSDLESARSLLEKALELDVTVRGDANARGLRCLSLGFPVVAAKEFQTAIQRNGPSAALLFNLGAAQWKSGCPDLARSNLERAVSLNPELRSAVDAILKSTYSSRDRK